MNNLLAIIIPAYKGEYLDKTLNSLSRQTDQRFTLYIGDDNSPYPLKDIIDQYSNQLDIVYHRFDNNLGHTNLIHHWERCIEMMNNEPYFCMFSDDDLMDPLCVSSFYQTLGKGTDCDVYHFNIDLINAEDKIIKHCTPFPSWISSEDFLRKLYTYQIDARMPEFIFRTEHFKKAGGFINFDLAYRSDNATVVACAHHKGICTFSNGRVFWRDSGTNLSASKQTELRVRRTQASIHFFEWLQQYYQKMNESCPFSLKDRLELILQEITDLKDCLPHKQLYCLLNESEVIKAKRSLFWRCQLYIKATLWEKQSLLGKIAPRIQRYCLNFYSNL